jgi:hypothetical protein
MRDGVRKVRFNPNRLNRAYLKRFGTGCDTTPDVRKRIRQLSTHSLRCVPRAIGNRDLVTNSEHERKHTMPLLRKNILQGVYFNCLPTDVLKEQHPDQVPEFIDVQHYDLSSNDPSC